MQTEKQKLGAMGEKMAKKFLMKQKFNILSLNYRKKWGEIDIVAKKDKTIHFVEVKTVSYETQENGYMPEENVHPWKIKRLHRAIETYLMENNVAHETEWQIDVIAVFANLKERKVKFRIKENVF